MELAVVNDNPGVYYVIGRKCKRDVGNAIFKAIVDDQFDCFKILVHKVTYAGGRPVIDVVAEYGTVEMAEWLLEHDHVPSDRTIRIAKKRGGPLVDLLKAAKS